MPKQNRLLAILIAAFILCSAVSVVYTSVHTGLRKAAAPAAADAVNIGTGAADALAEDRKVYSSQDPLVRNFYLTVLDTSVVKDSDAPLLDTISFAKMNTLNYHSPKYNLEAILQEGSETGPTQEYFGFNVKSANGIVSIRGKSTSTTDQKSYKITLYDSAGLWNGQRSLNLLKHPYDLTRMRSTVCMRLFQTIPDMTSLRTQLVHLYIKDLSSSKTTGEYVDYGLYEQVEAPNKKFLASHGLDVNGNLYKAENFEFYRNLDVIKETDDPLYDKDAFAEILDQKNGNSHHSLIEMLDAVNDYSLDINTVVDQYFDRDNYLTWLAMNILLDNPDTYTQNFYLYNPNNSGKWYFMPWDYDGALDYYNQNGTHTDYLAGWKRNISLYWGSVLHRRFLSDSDNIKQLEAKMDQMQKYINKDTIHAILQKYHDTVSAFVHREPDKSFLPGTLDQFEAEYWRLEQVPDQRKARFYAELDKPMPFFMINTVTHGTSGDTLQWDPSYDLQGDDLNYHATLARDPAMKGIVYDKDNIKQTSITVPALAPGKYYLKVTVTDAKGNSQESFDEYTDEFGHMYFSTIQVVVE